MHVTHQYYFGFQSQGPLSNWSNWLSKIFRNYISFALLRTVPENLFHLLNQSHAKLKSQARLGNPRFFPALFSRALKNFSIFFFLISFLIGEYFSFPVIFSVILFIWLATVMTLVLGLRNSIGKCSRMIFILTYENQRGCWISYLPLQDTQDNISIVS